MAKNAFGEPIGAEAVLRPFHTKRLIRQRQNMLARIRPGVTIEWFDNEMQRRTGVVSEMHVAGSNLFGHETPHSFTVGFTLIPAGRITRIVK